MSTPKERDPLLPLDDCDFCPPPCGAFLGRTTPVALANTEEVKKCRKCGRVVLNKLDFHGWRPQGKANRIE